MTRKAEVQLGRSFDGTIEPWSLHDLLDDDPRHGARRLAPTDYRERLQSRGLFRDRMLYAEALEPPAERLQSAYGADEATPPRFRRKTATIADRGVRDRSDERVIIKL